MIQIGVNENVFLEKAVLDSKNALEITFAEIGTGEARTAASPFADIAGDEFVEDAPDMSVKLFQPLITKLDVTAEKRIDMINADIKKTKGVLRHIMMEYMTSEELKGIWADAFMGLAIDANNYDQQIQVVSVLEGLHKNLARIFLGAMAPYVGNRELKKRLLLVRQSKDKHYATFRNKYLDESPFLESMNVPKEASKLWTPVDPKDPSKGYVPKWTRYEIDNDLTHGRPVPKTADAKTGNGAAGQPTQAPQTAASVFGNQ